jgi:hypothetical protein
MYVSQDFFKSAKLLIVVYYKLALRLHVVYIVLDYI